MIICFGEVLWDVFPHVKKVGGAPLNVALRLHSLKEKVAIISAIGNDDLGETLLLYLNSKKINTNYIQKNKYPTGEVSIHLDSSGSASYAIKQPVAWDYILFEEKMVQLVKGSSAFIFGSLALRNNLTRQTLELLLPHAKFIVFDVNLRHPFYSIALIEALLQKSDFVKFNDEELELIGDSIGLKGDQKQLMQAISKQYNCSHICVTRGGKGAILLKEQCFYDSLGVSVIVKDTVGAGDSFLASLISKLVVSQVDPQQALDFACAVGAIVASKEGANPEIELSEMSSFLDTN